MNGGRVPWNVTAICETYKINCLMRRHHMKDGSECPLNGSVMYCMLVESRKGDILVADIGVLEEVDASELHARKLNAKEVLTPMKGDNFIFPVADGTVKTAGGN